MVQLKVERVSLNFGGVKALSEVSLEVAQGELVSVIGPNGAGKTSLLNCISGFYHPSAGKITFEGHDLTHASPHQVTKFGIARAFQNIELFTGMSVLENLLMARHTFGHYNLLDNILIYGRAMRVGVENRRFCEEIIDFMELEPYRKALVGDLPYGVRKRVEVARALALSPKLLLLDEPMAGMTLEEKEDMVRFILDIRAERGTTIILIEHDLGVVMDISDRVYVLDFGQVIASGLPEEVSQNPRVQEAYVGVDHAV
ncbi:ABC transporter ATP-binding protein [Meiothermus ruber]|uniref:ABC transporter n=1 Tax=Meiothermus ruber (strain ATCC 35948 / DSM 1279 / VKM B-1258 / 21) TaxID=504728 RepID=M9X8U9_MEIRD|nr:ABC transporter ATP-binding protein [Meiothermus ruber]AGK03369.1 ABC transporter [Meiothermus ruber DSM 1279]MCL6529719.1 ABC transporter ATP-binding protein [Meiothermus ruber]